MKRKSISFSEYINRDWLNPANIFFKESFGLDYAGSDAVSKVPILFQHNEDWAFLSQFPPSFWTQAMYWRYNEGLLQASEARENHSRKHISAIKDWVPEVTLESRGKKYVFTGVPGGKGIYVGYNKMFTDFEKPVKLTNDYKAGIDAGVDYGYRPVVTTPEGPSIRDVDVFAKTPEDVKHHKDRTHHHRSAYKGGTIGMDMSRPERITSDFIDTLPDDDPLLAGVRGKSIEEKKKKLKEEPPHTMAGMPTMSSKTATKMIQTWIRAQGLGLLGSLDDNASIPDPVTGGNIQVMGNIPPSDITKRWPGHVGGKDGIKWTTPEGQQVGGQPLGLKVPVTEREISYYTVDAKGNKSEPKTEKFKIPVLLSSTLLPYISMPPEQKAAFAKRGAGEGAEDEEDDRKRRSDSGGVGSVLNLLNNADLLAPAQMQHLQDNKRDQMHILARQADPQDFDSKYADPHSVRYFNVGWTANKNTSGMHPHNLTKEQMKKVIEEYVPEDSKKLQHSPKFPCSSIKGDYTHIPGCNGGGLEGEAYEGIVSYMKAALGYKETASRGGKSRNDITSAVLQMMEAALPSLISTCAILLAIRLNDPTMGIWDKELGLTNVNPDFINKPESTRARRIRFASDFARELEQACLVDSSYGTRRSRKKLASQGKGGRREVSYTNQGDDEDREGNISGAETGRERSDDRERELAGSGVGDAKHVWKTHTPDNVARAGWLVPRVGNFADGFLQSKRNEIAKKASPEYALPIQMAKIAMKKASKFRETFLEEKERELSGKIADPEKRREAAEREVDETFQERLLQAAPDIYGSLTPSQLKDAINAARDREKYSLNNDDDEKQSPEEQEKVIADGGITRDMMNHLIEQNIDFLNNILKFEEGDAYGILYDDDQNPYVGIMDGMDETTLEELAKRIKSPEAASLFLTRGLMLPREAVNDYFVRFWVAISKETINPVTEQQAILDAQKLGLSPAEVQSKEPPPQQQTQQPAAIQQAPVTRTAAKDIGDLVNYIYEPQSPGETTKDIGAKVRYWLETLGESKALLKKFFSQYLAAVYQRPNVTPKEHAVIYWLESFLDDNPSTI